MIKSYGVGIVGMRWLTSPRDDVSPALQYALRPIHGGAVDWFDVPTEVAEAPAQAAAVVPVEARGELPEMNCMEFRHESTGMVRGGKYVLKEDAIAYGQECAVAASRAVQAQPVIPEGYALVPVEHTVADPMHRWDHMCLAAGRALRDHGFNSNEMVAAAEQGEWNSSNLVRQIVAAAAKRAAPTTPKD